MDKEYNHRRELSSFDGPLSRIRAKGFNPIGVTQMYFEDTFIFETQDEANKAWKTLEHNDELPREERVIGWWYGKKEYEETIKLYESDKKGIGYGTTVLTYWL